MRKAVREAEGMEGLSPTSLISPFSCYHRRDAVLSTITPPVCVSSLTFKLSSRRERGRARRLCMCLAMRQIAILLDHIVINANALLLID